MTYNEVEKSTVAESVNPIIIIVFLQSPNVSESDDAIKNSDIVNETQEIPILNDLKDTPLDGDNHYNEAEDNDTNSDSATIEYGVLNESKDSNLLILR